MSDAPDTVRTTRARPLGVRLAVVGAKVLLVLMSTLLCLGFLELAVRVAMPQQLITTSIVGEYANVGSQAD